jgi:hypothetical protein
VLLTVLRPELAADPEAVARQRRAAATLARLDGEHCPRLREALPAEPAPVIVTGYVDGVTARQVLAERHALTGPQACAVLAGVLGGLSAVHRLDLVHRDVRPENVLLDAGGGLLLSGFELAAPGAENAGSPAGAPPYAGPQQRRGEPVDARADLWSCGVLLGELLTGRPPVVDEATGELLLDAEAGAVPEPMTRFLARVLATDPALRPAWAGQMLDDLSTVAADAYGPDWMRLGALTGAVVLPGGVVAAGAVAGAAVPAVAVSGGVTAALPAGGAAVTTTAGFGAKVTAFATPALALATAAVVVVFTAFAANAAPPNAPEVITPEAARVIFVRTVGEFRAGDLRHAPDIDDLVRSAVGQALPSADLRLANITVGVPRGQRGYPAWFTAYATVTHPDGDVYTMLLRFVRTSAGGPWLVVRFQLWRGVAVPPPLLDSDGHLAQAPVGDLIADPASLPQRYLDWARRAAQSHAVGTDPLLDAPDSQFLAKQAIDRFDGDRSFASFQYEFGPGAVIGDPIPMANGTVLVEFTATMHQTVYNRPRFRTGPCDLWVWTDLTTGRLRMYKNRFDVSVTAWVPMKNGAAPPAAPAGQRPIPVKPDKVYLTDGWNATNITIQRC